MATAQFTQGKLCLSDFTDLNTGNPDLPPFTTFIQKKADTAIDAGTVTETEIETGTGAMETGTAMETAMVIALETGIMMKGSTSAPLVDHTSSSAESTETGLDASAVECWASTYAAGVRSANQGWRAFPIPSTAKEWFPNPTRWIGNNKLTITSTTVWLELEYAKGCRHFGVFQRLSSTDFDMLARPKPCLCLQLHQQCCLYTTKQRENIITRLSNEIARPEHTFWIYTVFQTLLFLVHIRLVIKANDLPNALRCISPGTTLPRLCRVTIGDLFTSRMSL
ncbi:hypothetical protein CONLIGDRAFT_718713 [Coniochaeta ligniaria NRRL 30616]|uniref:Uncharacterized protein n=1 Tax=Coniochaeta ligniaria NRRL 30616 TaxID=1408157 RepID=A0A1J7J9W2_9PEZI|nr:hypothetical protein CONLIGDRAFT_718713 [Coniochaeta ligniaria NRRL 30616]